MATTTKIKTFEISVSISRLVSRHLTLIFRLFHLMIDGLQHAVHATVGDEHFGGGVGEYGLLGHPGQDEHVGGHPDTRLAGHLSWGEGVGLLFGTVHSGKKEVLILYPALFKT